MAPASFFDVKEVAFLFFSYGGNLHGNLIFDSVSFQEL
jgi:hypothetical protein